MKSEEDKRVRREVANNNERRRMQSINSGFENLRKLLPPCFDNEKISKALILKTTAKYILELQTKINSLENEMLQSKSDLNKCTLTDLNNCPDVRREDFTTNETKPMDIFAYQNDLGSSTSSLTTDNLSTSTISLKSCDIDAVINVAESHLIIDDTNADNYQPQSNLEHLLAAVAQVERQEAMQTTNDITRIIDISRLHYNTHSCYDVMKPTISPYAEKIIEDAAKMHIPFMNHALASPMDNSTGFIGSHLGTEVEIQPSRAPVYRSTKIAIPHKYLHRPDVVTDSFKEVVGFYP